MMKDTSAHAAINDLLAQADAQVCAKCGKQAVIPFQAPTGLVRFCFECGHEEPPRDEDDRAA